MIPRSHTFVVHSVVHRCSGTLKAFVVVPGDLRIYVVVVVRSAFVATHLPFVVHSIYRYISRFLRFTPHLIYRFTFVRCSTLPTFGDFLLFITHIYSQRYPHYGRNLHDSTHTHTTLRYCSTYTPIYVYVYLRSR